ncbi:hypothetical protein GQ54DRAFT_307362 [Martensiomyces pterosporus]|nr:hypothetical protein GQ54DRAFT_307362 [Martensiomyces pterosporus]
MALARLKQLVTSTADSQGSAISQAVQNRCQAAQARLDKLTAATSKLVDIKVRALEEAMVGESRNIELVDNQLKCFQEDMEKVQAELKDAWAEADITVAAGRVDEMLCPKMHALVEGSTLLSHLPPLVVTPGGVPALHSVDTVVPAPEIQFNPRLEQGVIEFQEATLRNHPRLEWEQFGPVLSSRSVSAEAELTRYFEGELFPRVKRIFHTVEENAELDAVEGNPTNHADYFIVVNASVKVGDSKVRKQSALAVEFKLPHSIDSQPRGQVVASAADLERVDPSSRARFPTAVFGTHVVRQLHAYVRDKGKRCGRISPNTINPHIGVISTINHTWISRFEGRVRTSGRGVFGAAKASLSMRFTTSNREPHPAFAIAFVLVGIAEHMRRHPSEYANMSRAALARAPDAVPYHPRRHANTDPYHILWPDDDYMEQWELSSEGNDSDGDGGGDGGGDGDDQDENNEGSSRNDNNSSSESTNISTGTDDNDDNDDSDYKDDDGSSRYDTDGCADTEKVRDDSNGDWSCPTLCPQPAHLPHPAWHGLQR